ncbi:23S rRNA (adenine(2503)-C(2))-methyltransferase RlmN, partial [bacterium]|nr:23S rRNA (adenine(2503)-C(2))-methyltransferase RlmN [bacterium]
FQKFRNFPYTFATTPTKDGELIEGVSIKDGKRHTLCISTQAGCSFACAFCASGKNGFVRNLSTGEIIDQIRIMTQDKPATNLVFMGGGEPLANYDNFKKAYNIIIDQRCLGIGQRKITVSTAGYLPGISKLVKSDLRPVLALSLHSPFNTARSEIMPINKKYPIEPVLKECSDYAKISGRQITIEYIVIPDFNISGKDIKELIKLFINYPAKINLIPLNPIAEFNFRSPSKNEVERVATLLRDNGIFASIRWSKGSGIDAACGQLRVHRNLKNGKEK